MTAACSCSYEDRGSGESGPSLSVVADAACPLHGREAEPAEWAEFDAWVAGSPPESPEEAAYWASLEAEQARLAALPKVEGRSAVAEAAACDGCGKTATLYGRSAYTLGWAGHPGAELSEFRVCEECLR